MQGLDPFDEDAAGVVFRDVILLALLGFVAVVILLLPHVNPPKSKAADMTTPGNVIVQIKWPDQIDADVDLWVLAPGDRPVGYSAPQGLIFDLLRDDLGHFHDVTSANYEIAYSRGIPAGEYVVNVHMYRDVDGVWPVPVIAIVSVKNDPAKPARQILVGKVNLVRENQEVTVFRFRLDDKGSLITSSVNQLFKELRNADKGKRL